MTIYCIKNYFSLILFLGVFACFSQNTFNSLGETAFSVNHNVSNSYKIDFALQSRYYIYRENYFGFDQRQLDIIHFSTYKLDYRHSLSLGLQYRMRSPFDYIGDEFRITEQFNYTNQHIGFRTGHRFRSEQRIFESTTVYRQRYRFAIDMPLNGDKLDVGETYFVASMELLWSLNAYTKGILSYRTTTQIGWQLSEKFILQLGVEYRIIAFNISTQNSLFFYTSAILKI